MKIWWGVILGSVLSIVLLWFTSIPLGIPGEWTWDRAAAEPDLFWNLVGGAIAASLFATYVLIGWRRLEDFSTRSGRSVEKGAWLAGLILISFGWLWIVQELGPIRNRLGKSPFVLYYPSSSGYFTRARYDEPDPASFLAGYEDLMRQGDVLHTGTHPPGLFLVFHGLIAACQSSPQLSAFLDATRAFSFEEACDVIAENNLRSRVPVKLLPLDRRVLWLATLLVMASASLTVLPLFGLIRRRCTAQTAWVCAALWPAVPAVAIFVPKSDTVFPLIGLTLLWLWLTAWDRRSLILAALAGLVAWCGLLCSLAFLPVLLAAGIFTLGTICCHLPDVASLSTRSNKSFRDFLAIDRRQSFCIVAAGVGFALLTFLLWKFAQINLLNVWIWNYVNHAGFYQHYPRTYWGWLLVNPVELSFAAGWPVTWLALVACVSVLAQGRREWKLGSRIADVAPLVLVWSLLWITGKNSGEAARIWILFLPWLIWIAGIEYEAMSARQLSFEIRQKQAIALVGIQFAVCLLTVARVSGFHAEGG